MHPVDGASLSTCLYESSWTFSIPCKLQGAWAVGFLGLTNVLLAGLRLQDLFWREARGIFGPGDVLRCGISGPAFRLPVGFLVIHLHRQRV